MLADYIFLIVWITLSRNPSKQGPETDSRKSIPILPQGEKGNDNMKKLLCLLLTLTMVLAPGASAFADDAAKAPVFKDGAAQPILQYTNLRDANYVNEGSDILRFCVYVETDHDTDGDGKADLVVRPDPLRRGHRGGIRHGSLAASQSRPL